MNAAILAIGDELTLGQNLDTNTRWLAEALGARAVVTVEHRTVEDDRAAIAGAISELAGRADLLITTGGLGPTEDDLTREALGDVVDPGAPLVVDEQQQRRLEQWFRGRAMPDGNLRQVRHPPSARMITNAHGTAPGMETTVGACRVFVLPGPPREMIPMFRDQVAPALPPGDLVLASATVQEYGLGESDAAARLGALTARDRRPLVGTTASRGIVTARIRDRGPRDDVTPAIEATVAQVRAAWYPWAFGRDGRTLAAAAGRLLAERGETVVTAESCTGGWLGKRFVDVSGASVYYLGGWVTYADAMKRDRLAVPSTLLETHGAVSEPVARAMAEGAATRAGADWSIAITGVAGPDGGTEAKPVGTVFIAVCRAGVQTQVRRFRIRADREQVRERSVHAALQMLRLALLDEADAALLWEVTE